VTAAFYDADEAAPACLDGTRTALLDDIRTWFENTSDDCPRFFWLSGIAGTGKTTVTQSVCEIFKNCLLGTFFFSGDSVERRRPSNILPTLMYRLAYARPDFRRSICDVITKDPDVSSKGVRVQMDKLIAEGMMNVQVSDQSSYLFVLDALDECDKEGSTFIPLFIQYLSSLPLHIKVFITSRPEVSIRKILESSTSPTRLFALHQIDTQLVQSDIRLYLLREFTEIARKHDMKPPWPTEEQMHLLVERAGCLFIYASTAVKFVSGSIHPFRALLLFLSVDARQSKFAHATLDSMYLRIIQGFTMDPIGETSTIFQEVVGSIVALEQPLSRFGLGNLLQLETEEVSSTLRPLHSLFDVGTSSNHPIRAFHPSFSDFLINPERCTDEKLRVNIGDTHLLLATRCIKVMNRQLKQDICNIGDSSSLNSEIVDIDNIRSQHISEELRYACMYWMSHVASTQTNLDINELELELSEFCVGHLLHWIEALSLAGELRSAVEGLPRVKEWCKVRIVILTM
jgi:hypothetical protein